MFGKRLPETPESVMLFPKEQSFGLLKDRIPILIEFQGALVDKDADDQLTYTPRGKISVNPARIAGYYDHTILIDGYKVRVMETYAQIALKLMEAERG